MNTVERLVSQRLGRKHFGPWLSIFSAPDWVAAAANRQQSQTGQDRGAVWHTLPDGTDAVYLWKTPGCTAFRQR